MLYEKETVSYHWRIILLAYLEFKEACRSLGYNI